MTERPSNTKPALQRYLPWVLGLAIALGLAFAAWTPDLPRAFLVAKYGGVPSKFVTLPSGARAHYRDQGNQHGPLLVLLHGSSSSLHTWEPWVRLLGDAFRIVSVDLPGHGLTGPVPSDDYSLDGIVGFVDEFRRQLGITHFYLAGNSMGGSVSWRYTLAHPDVVDKLVLVDAAGLTHLLPKSEQPVLPAGMRLIRTPGINLIASVFTPRRAVEGSTRAVFVDQSKVNAEMVDRYYELLLHPGNRRATRLRAAAPVDFTACDRLQQIHASTLILSGQRDTFVPVQAARLLHQRISGSELIEYPNVGHVPMEEIPERTASDVRAFLSRAAAR